VIIVTGMAVEPLPLIHSMRYGSIGLPPAAGRSAHWSNKARQANFFSSSDRSGNVPASP
jgi:hypothetical protein